MKHTCEPVCLFFAVYLRHSYFLILFGKLPVTERFDMKRLYHNMQGDCLESQSYSPRKYLS